MAGYEFINPSTLTSTTPRMSMAPSVASSTGSSGLGGWGGVAMGVSSAIGSILGTASQVSAIKAQSDATIRQIEAEADSYVFETSIVQQQRREARRELGDVMTDIGLQAVEAEAEVRARNAMRGVSGGSVQQASTEVAMKANLANADAIRQYENTDITLLRRNLASRVDFENRITSLASGIQSPSSAFMSTLSGSVSGFGSGLQMYQQYDYFQKNMG